ncbi:chromosome segregation protein SMC [Fusibacter bizertensis]
MYLKQVEMRGFKSFADKTVVEFREGVTCVVGPNGSGKSNITDAVRWVLGEQRVKTLRGNKMEDVIFSGTKHRKSLGLAEVKLTFDNTSQFFPLDYEEITVVRRVHRSGESEYYINQLPCRLKDIRELFMDTGIGREGYSIIGQGRIDEILSNNKDERRLLFEEAAGIIKFKSRKIESERKLKATSENLLRIQDILSEIEDRVEPLKLESERAKQFIDLTEALKNIELNYYAKRYLECEQSLLEFLEQMRSLEDLLKSIDDSQSNLKTVYNDKDRQMYDINKEIRTLEAQFHELQNYESKTNGDKELVLEKIANTSLNIKRLEEELNELRDNKNNIKRSLELLLDEKEILDEEHFQNTAKLKALLDKLSISEQSLIDTKFANDQHKRGVIDQLNQIELKKQENDTLIRLSGTLNEKIEILKQQLTAQSSIIEQSTTDKEAVLKILDSSLAQNNLLNEKLASAIQFMEYNKKSHLDAVKEFEKNNSLLSQSETEHNLLKTLEEEYDGYDKGVKDILMRLEDQTGIIGIVATIIEVPKKYEVAIEVALGRAIQNIVCEKISDAKRSIEYLRKNNLGRVTFLPLENLEEKGQQIDLLKKVKEEPGYIGVAKDLVKVDEKFENLSEFLLGRILIVEDFDTAGRLIRIKNLKYKVITLQGDILVPGGAISGGSFRSKVSNILGRKRRIAELGEQIDKLTIERSVIAEKISQLNQTVSEHEMRVKNIREEQDKLRLDIIRLEHVRDNHDQAVGASKDVYEKYKADYLTLVQEYDESLATIEVNKTLIESLEKEVSDVENALTDANVDLEILESEVKNITEDSNALKIKIASLDQTIAFKQREILRIQDDMETHEQRLEMRNKQIADYVERNAIYDEQVVEMTNRLIQIKADLLSCKKDIELRSEVKQGEYKALDLITKELADLSTKHEDTKDQLHKLEVKKAKIEVEKDTVVSELWEKYEMSIAEALQIQEVPYQKSEMKQLRYELKLLGTVNVNAIKEYEEVSTRFAFLTEQKKDLLEAISQLEKIIVDLEKKMIVMFKENFEIINNYFKGTFKSLFNGGDAELILADYDDILDCDIEIIAQPPGKKLQSINLLSGGEKALTAIALLFAILSTKPTPFCILDEIEAALDDVNVYRFADFIKEYAANSQFVVITHRKGTMEVADTLYGVTMEEYGISKVLSVKLEDIAAQLD